MKTAKYLAMLDSFAANLAGLTDNDEQLRMMRRTSGHLREELLACEALELQAAGICTQQLAGAVESAGSKQARLGLARKLEGVVEQFRRGYPLHLRQNWASASHSFQAAQALLRTAVMSRLLADIGIKTGRLADAQALCAQAETICAERGLTWLSEVVWLRGVIHGRLDKYAEALAEDDRAVAIRDAQGLPPLAGLALHRGFLLGSLGRWEEALAAYAEGADLRQAQGEPAGVQPVHCVGYCYEELEHSLDPIRALEKTADILDERGLPPDADLTLHQGAYLHERQSFEHEEAVYLDYLRRCQQHRVTPCYPVAKALLRARLAQRKPIESQLAYDSADEVRRQLAMPVPPKLLFELALVYGALFNKPAMCHTAQQALEAYAEQAEDAPDLLHQIIQECSET